MDFKDRLGIDLHIHSNASDGTCSPLDILRQAQGLGLGAVAITDHDAIDGSLVAVRHAAEHHLDCLSGVEISAAYPPAFDHGGSLHILGYGFQSDNPELNAALARLQQARRDRNPQIFARLRAQGFDLSLTEISKKDSNMQVGRPHIADLMVKKGYVRSIDEAFDRYLGKGRPAYVDKYRLAAREAIDLLRNAGGVPVLAHPYLIRMDATEGLAALVRALEGMGLMGIEVFYPEHPRAMVSLYRDLAKRHGLLMTGGTDFHGKIKPEVRIGSGKGDFFVPYELYEALCAARNT